MCEITSLFKLCSCSAGNGGTPQQNKNSGRYAGKIAEKNKDKIIWTLSEYAGKQDTGMEGLLMAPAEKLTEIFTADYVKQELNSRNCFDFSYAPKEGDYLVFTFYRTKAEQATGDYRFLPFIFREGAWTANSYDGFEDKIVEIGNGKLNSE